MNFKNICRRANEQMENLLAQNKKAAARTRLQANLQNERQKIDAAYRELGRICAYYGLLKNDERAQECYDRIAVSQERVCFLREKMIELQTGKRASNIVAFPEATPPLGENRE